MSIASGRVVQYLVNTGVGPLPIQWQTLSGIAAIPQSWQDSYSGDISTTLVNSLSSGGLFVKLDDLSYLPTQNQWYGQIDDEILLMDGTSGNISFSNVVSIFQRGAQETLQVAHDSGSVLNLIVPDSSYDVNAVIFEKGQFVYPNNQIYSGLQGVNIVPQIQTVQVLSSDSTTINNQELYSGQVFLIDTTQSGFAQYVGQEYIWVYDRNSSDVSGSSSGGLSVVSLASGKYYDGQFIGYSSDNSGFSQIAPVYAVTDDATFMAFYNYRVPTYLISGGISSGSVGTTSGPVLVEPIATQFYSDPANFATWQNFISGTADGRVMLIPGVADHGPSTAGDVLIPAVPLNPQGNTRSQWGDFNQNPNAPPMRQAYGLVAPYPQNWAGYKWFNDGCFVGSPTAFINDPHGRFYSIARADFGSTVTIAAGVGSGDFLASGGPQTYFPEIFIQALHPLSGNGRAGNGTIAEIQFQTIQSGTGFIVGPGIFASYDTTHSEFNVSGFPFGSLPTWTQIELDAGNVFCVGGLSVAGYVDSFGIPTGTGSSPDSYLFLPVSASGNQNPPFAGRGAGPNGFFNGAPMLYNPTAPLFAYSGAGALMIYDYNVPGWFFIPTGSVTYQLENVTGFNRGATQHLGHVSGGAIQWISG